MISLKDQGGNTNQQARRQPASQRVVPKPIPEAQAKDPRGYQIEQLRRRFSPRESAEDDTTFLNFRIKPSDPDFPYDLDFLQCELAVPPNYPEEFPVLKVKNKNIPRGFAINVENGWNKLVYDKPGATLLALTQALDKNLEMFLAEQKVETLTLLSFKEEQRTPATSGVSTPTPAATAQPPAAPAPSQAQPLRRPPTPEPAYSTEQIAEAKARRAQETRQIETRMGRLGLYRRSVDGIVYTLPLDPKRRSELPPGLQAVKTLHMIVPLLYPLQPLRIQLNEVDSMEAEPLEDLIADKMMENKQLSLMSQLNYLTQHLHTLAKQSRALAEKKQTVDDSPIPVPQKDAGKGPATATRNPLDKSHVQVIARPPEWSNPRRNDGTGSSEEFDSSDSDEYSDEGGVALNSDQPAMASGDTAERGIALSFPAIELHGLEILQVSILNISIKCERCKTINEVTGLRDEKEQTLHCSKCAAGLAARFRPQLVHQMSTRAGFLDVAGATISDMLPSTFIPVCAKCSTPSHGLVSVRGENTTNICRECHSRFTFKIPDVRFAVYTPGMLSAPSAAAAGNRKEKLGLHAGEPLPNRGVCSHYRKSYRWFRFSCCNKVYRCDRCHDEAESHLNEWANRMICGLCSREQRYAVDSCGFCGRSVIGRKGRGFWEGGKGTRDRTLMSRKDKRKFKRIGPSEAGKKE